VSQRYEKKAAEIFAYVRRYWRPGQSVKSQLDGKEYETADEYAQHLLDSGAAIVVKNPAERNQ
jgi:hypothetical protein